MVKKLKKEIKSQLLSEQKMRQDGLVTLYSQF